MPPGLTIPSIFTAIDRFSGPVMRMRGVLGGFMKTASGGMAIAERGFNQMISPINRIQDALRGLGIYIGLFSAMLLFGKSVKIMADFEQAQVNIASVIDTSSLPLMREMGLEARKLALLYGQSAAAISNFQFELVKMGFSAQDAIKMTEPITTGAVALRTTPERLQEVIGAILKSHDMPVIDAATGRNNAQQVVNQFAYTANATAAQFEDLATMLPIVNRLTDKMNISFPQALAVLGQLRNVQIHTSTGATSFKNILLDIKADSWEDLRTQMMKVLNAKNQTLYAYNKFGKKSVITAVEIANMFGSIEKMSKQIEGVDSGYTSALASKQLESTYGHINRFKSAYAELVLAIDNGNGPIADAIKRYFDIGSAVLLFAADSEAAHDRLRQLDVSVLAAAESWGTWLKWIGRVVAILLVMKATLIGWNIVLGIYNLGVLAATKATWLWTAAMAANPIGAIALAVLALTTGLVLMIKYWDDWGAAVAVLLGPLGLVISSLKTLYDRWDAIKTAFTSEGILAGLKAIGIAILDSMLYPVQKLFELSASLTGLESSKNMAKMIQRYRDLFLSPGMTTANQAGKANAASMASPIMGPEEKKNEVLSTNHPKNMMEYWHELMGKVAIDINNKSGLPVTGNAQGAVQLNMKPSSTFDY